MRTIKIFLAGIVGMGLICALGVGIEPPDRAKVEVRSKAGLLTPAYPWIGKGDLLRVDILCDDGPSASLVLYEPKKSKERLLVTGSVTAVARIVREANQDVDRSFLAEKLPHLLLLTCADRGCALMDAGYLAAYQESTEKDAKTEAFLRSHCRAAVAVKKGNEWELAINVIDRDGESFEWILTGTVNAFEVRSSMKRILSQSGEIKPLLIYGG